MSTLGHKTAEDPLSFFPRVINRLYTQWVVWTYPFHSVGRNFRAHSSCELGRRIAPFIKIGDAVRLDRDVWLNIASTPSNGDPVIVLHEGCLIGRCCMISAQNSIEIGRNTIFGPSVMLKDHDGEFGNEGVSTPNREKARGGRIRIEEGCWLGFGSAVISTDGELVIGKNSVISANSVVTRTVPPFSVVAGNPARVVKHYEPSKGLWVIGG
jgi:acetyltransferase-like isoleucine patch superfamily enzyme